VCYKSFKESEYVLVFAVCIVHGSGIGNRMWDDDDYGVVYGEEFIVKCRIIMIHDAVTYKLRKIY